MNSVLILNTNDLAKTIMYLTNIIVQQKVYQYLKILKELKASDPDLCKRKIINPEILRDEGTVSLTSSQSAKSGNEKQPDWFSAAEARSASQVPNSQLHITGRTDSK